jgi:serine/threonine-protein phosphatase 2B catalytic subunit
VWADPMEDEDAVKKDFTENSERACSYKYGLDPVKKILDDNDFTLLIRAHQVQVQGYKMHYWETPQVLPSVITLFSAPNYCDVYKNKGAVIKLEGENFSIKNFEEVTHPYHLPQGMNLFQFSIPYLAEKVLDMVYNMIMQGNEEEIVDDMPIGELHRLVSTADEIQKLKIKVSSVGRMRRMYKNLKENSEQLLLLKIANDGKIPRGLLLEGRPAIRNAMKEFQLAINLDKENEKRPLPK